MYALLWIFAEPPCPPPVKRSSIRLDYGQAPLFMENVQIYAEKSFSYRSDLTSSPFSLKVSKLKLQKCLPKVPEKLWILVRHPLPLARGYRPNPSFFDFTAITKKFMTLKISLSWPARQTICSKHNFNLLGKSIS